MPVTSLNMQYLISGTLKIKDKCKSDVILHNLFSNLIRVCKFSEKITLIK